MKEVNLKMKKFWIRYGLNYGYSVFTELALLGLCGWIGAPGSWTGECDR